jgi:FdhE protein
MTPNAWLEAHAYLRPLAELSAEVDRATAEIGIPEATVPDWDDYRADFLAGVTLLHSADAAVDLDPGGRTAAALIERLALAGSSGWLAAETRALHAELQGDPQAARRIVDFLLEDRSAAPPFAGLMRYLGWTVMARFIGPIVLAFNSWRDEEKWQRRYCPTCGSLPAMAQLVPEEHAHLRRLSCGCCGTRWRYGRTMCPFCQADTQRLSAITVEGECGLRIDYCESCRGYLKTYVGEGSESVLLADWTSLHLDLVAADRGLKREAASLYDLAASPTQERCSGVVEESRMSDSR